MYLVQGQADIGTVFCQRIHIGIYISSDNEVSPYSFNLVFVDPLNCWALSHFIQLCEVLLSLLFKVDSDL